MNRLPELTAHKTVKNLQSFENQQSRKSAAEILINSNVKVKLSSNKAKR